MEWILEKILLYPRRSLAVLAGLVLVGGFVAWWHFVWQSPVRVFDDMLANSLSTTSVTKLVKAENGSSSVDQTVRLEMNGTNAANWLVTARQTGATVATESIGTPTAGYIRYTQIATGQQKSAFSKVVDTWGKSDGKTDVTLNQLFEQTILDINNAPPPPIANLTSEQRSNLLGYMRRENVFAPDYKAVRFETVNGRWAYIYSVKVTLAAYVQMIKTFASYLGFSDVKTLDPQQYQNIPPLDVTMAVDASSHQLLKVSFATSGFVQSYTDWGLLTPVELPTHIIPTTELQARLQAVTTAR